MSIAEGSTYAGVPVINFDPGEEMPVLGNIRLMQELRSLGPILRSSAAQGFWVVTDGEMVREVLTDPTRFSSSATVPTIPNPEYLFIPQMLDPPEHTVWRNFLAPYFSPGNLGRLEDSVRIRCAEILDGLVGKGHCDYRHEFADRYPTSIFLDMFGLPSEDLSQFLAWGSEILHLSLDQDPDGSRRTAASMEVMGYMQALLEQRRKDPRDDIVSHSLSWQIDGKPIPTEQLLSFCLLMFVAGLDTVSIQLTYSMWHLATHPDQRRLLVANPDLMRLAVEELLRLYSFVPPSKKLVSDINFHGVEMKAGEMVYVSTKSVALDPTVFPDPENAVLDRQPNPHAAFGLGPHRCLGAALARRELLIAMEQWHHRIPDYRIAPGAQIRERGLMHGIISLPLEWD